MTGTTSSVARREGLRRFSVLHFLIALVLLLVTMPFVEELDNGDLIETALMTLVLLSAVMAVGGRRQTLIVACLLVTPSVVGAWIDHFRTDELSRELALAADIIFVAFVVVHLLRFILRSPTVTSEVLCAAISIYLMQGILWAFVYELLASRDPRSFAFTDPEASMASFEALYFSFGTLTTINYGAVQPVSNAARLFVMVEATTSVFYLAVLIARVVSAYSSNQPKESGAPAGSSSAAPEVMDDHATYTNGTISGSSPQETQHG